jgi:hypothetical protein
MMERKIQPELLDEMPGDDPRAIGSRRDLRRINAWMGNARFTIAALSAARIAPPRRIVDLGAGDGDFLRRLTRHLPALPPGLEVVLVDRINATDEHVLAELRSRGFIPHVERADVVDWLRAAPVQSGTWIVANLFLHHFTAAALRSLFAVVAEKSDLFCACEPRRASWPLAASRLLWFLGANAVTRHDAVVSVGAGFNGRELSALWSMTADWCLREHRAGLFSHVFLAQRTEAAANA